MILDETKALEIIKGPKSKALIQAVKDQESQLRVFTEDLSSEEVTTESYWNRLTAQMKTRSAKKFPRVIQFSRFPLPIVQISDSILNDYFRVFDGKNRYFNVTGDRDIERLQDWIKINAPEVWIEKHAKDVFKNKPNTFVVVDRDESGNPYLINIDSERLIDAEFKNNQGDLEYIVFVHSIRDHETKEGVQTQFIGVYDDETYFVFSKDSDADAYIKVHEHKHGIGYCPAKSFIKTPTNSKNNFKRRVAFSSAVSKMEDWTLFDIYRNYVDHYAPFPITEAPKSKCPNDDCENGRVREEITIDAREGTTKETWTDCPACEGGTNDGVNIMPGTHIGIKVQASKDMEDGSGKFRMIFPDVENMKYVPEKLDDIEMEIRYKTVGVNQLMDKEAVNELQVKGSFESMESVLLRVKGEMDTLYRWIVKTIGRSIYTSLEVSVEANFGTEFYLISEEDLQKRFKEAKAIGLPMEEQVAIYHQLIETKYKGNPEKIARQKMILELDPLPLYTVPEAMEMKDKNIIDNFDLSMKLNFINFIARFERENTSITEFGIDLDLWKRVEKIREILNNYNNETIKSKQLQPSGEGVEQP